MNQYNPDYGDDPEVLRGVISDQGEAIGHLTDELTAMTAERDALNKLMQGCHQELAAIDLLCVSDHTQTENALESVKRVVAERDRLEAGLKEIAKYETATEFFEPFIEGDFIKMDMVTKKLVNQISKIATETLKG